MYSASFRATFEQLRKEIEAQKSLLCHPSCVCSSCSGRRAFIAELEAEVASNG